MNKKGYVFWLASWLLATLFYIFWLRGMVQQVFDGTAPGWFAAVVNWTYPRFAVEKHRFELAFFVRHADQATIRFGLVNVAALALVFVSDNYAAVRHYWAGFWNLRVSPARLRLYRVFFYAGILYFSHDWYFHLAGLHQAKDFYRPVLPLRLLHLPFPPPWVSGILCAALAASCLLAVWGFRRILFSGLAAVLFTLLQGWLFSFEKWTMPLRP